MFSCEENLLGQHSQKILNSYFELYYSKEEQKKIFCECIKNQDPGFLYDPSLADIEGREAEAFVGVSVLCHPYNLALSETVFESIYRHSFDGARDIQTYGEVLTMLPNFWGQTNNFKRLMNMFDRNLMFVKDVRDVCKKFNGLKNCKERAL